MIGAACEHQVGPGKLAALLPDRPQLFWALGWVSVFLTTRHAIDGILFIAFAALPLGAVGVGLLVSGIWRGWEMRDTPVAGLLTALLIPGLVMLLPTMSRAIDWAEFRISKSRYDEIVRHVTVSGAKQGLIDRSGQGYIIDRGGGTVRIAFVTDPGVVDNWAGVVYDPTNAVAAARGLGTLDPQIQELFGGDIVGCWSLARHYYRCGFT